MYKEIEKGKLDICNNINFTQRVSFVYQSNSKYLSETVKEH